MKDKKKVIIAGILIAALLVLICFIVAVGSAKETPIKRVARDQKMVTLTFDTVWGDENIQTIIGILAKYNIKGTFFVSGQWVEKYPESARSLIGAGHELMNGSDTYSTMTKFSPEEILTELNACNRKIEMVTGSHPTLFRAPYGTYNDQLISTVRAAGMEIVQWDVDGGDKTGADAARIVKTVTSGVKPGSIVRFHNGTESTTEALPQMIETLLQEGYTFVPLSWLILPQPYSIDLKTGEQSKGVESLGEATLVGGQTDDPLLGGDKQSGALTDTSGTAEDPDAGGTSANSYFDAARLNRQQSRDNALSLLQQAAGAADTNQAMKDELNTVIQTMASLTVSEAQIENLVTARGYADCVAFIGDKSVSVVVAVSGEGGLTDADVVKISEIVREQTGFSASQIKIIEANQ